MSQSLLKKPSACVPLAMSAAGLAIVLVHAARYGIVHDADEGTSAHLFQIIMVAQVPIVAFFAITWLPRSPKPALQILAMQAGAILAAFASVYFLT